MSDSIEENKIILEAKSRVQPYGYFIPSQIQNANSLLKLKEEITKLSWEAEGEKVRRLKF